MSKVPSVNYPQVISALRRDRRIVVRQKGSHIRLQKRLPEKILKIIVPTHHPMKRSTLSHILKQAHLSVERFIVLL